jgi:cysteinyl-tRNA synthetase
MPPRLHDTLLDRLTALEPGPDGTVRLYVCGPTVYDHPHLGHMRVYVVYDVLVRHLREQGYAVRYVRNITDVDDKILRRAQELGEAPEALTQRFIEAYRDAAQKLACLTPDAEPKVTEHMAEIEALIAQLIENGSAYAAQGDVYFSVESFAGYGKLSHRKLADLELGASGRVADEELERKRHPADFALWKGAKAGEPAWPSAWGPGRPGWHIECSAMSMKHLGESFELHGGGLDLVFPHHENEIAQSEAASGKPLAKLWVHNGFIEVNKEKMSKSRGNFFSVRECFRFVEPEALRYFIQTSHYRAPLALDWQDDASGNVCGFPQIEESERRVEYLYATRLRLDGVPDERIAADDGAVDPELRALPAKLAAALDEDLNMPLALAVLAEFLKRVNDAVDAAGRKKGKLGAATRDAMLDGFALFGRVLGLGLDDAAAFGLRVRTRRLHALGLDQAQIERKIAARIAARQSRDFSGADAIRDELLGLGVELMDGPAGTSWRLR